VLSKFRAPFGGELGSAYIGGSAMPVEVANFFEDIGIAICEGYGLTETSPLICVNPFNVRTRRTGTVSAQASSPSTSRTAHPPPFLMVWRCFDGLQVGQLIAEADVRVVRDDREVPRGEEGELWVHGPFVFKGYHKKPQETAEAFGDLHGRRYFKVRWRQADQVLVRSCDDGWGFGVWQTGDLGKFTEEGLIKITGRVKELYKLENGKYVAPGLIEKALAENDLFQQVRTPDGSRGMT
jgi:long-chain acyl-CoA synthetase